MKIGFIGLGKMGSRMVTRLLKAGHTVVVEDVNKTAIAAAVSAGATEATDRVNLINQLDRPVIWLMIPSNLVDQEVDQLLEHLPPHAIIIDGGNSDYRLTIARAKRTADKQVDLIDVGTSGGILGEENGYSLMVGGDKLVVDQISEILNSLAQTKGWAYLGPSGSGHFVKMVHNAIEYGLMESYAEGYRLLKEGPYNTIDLATVGDVWQHGSIIESLLNETITGIMKNDQDLSDVDGYVAESGEARWSLDVAKAHGINMSVIQAALDARLASQHGDINYATKLLAATRNRFGGHPVNKP